MAAHTKHNEKELICLLTARKVPNTEKEKHKLYIQNSTIPSLSCRPDWPQTHRDPPAFLPLSAGIKGLCHYSPAQKTKKQNIYLSCVPVLRLYHFKHRGRHMKITSLT